MATEKEKQQTLKKLRPQLYQIYGIFNFKTRELLCVSLDEAEIELRFELDDCGEDCDIVKFTTMIH